MDTFASLLAGFGVALTIKNLGLGFLGVLLGTAVGVLPGLGPGLTIALLLPVTAQFDPTGALIMFAGIYYGAMYGGSTTSILLNTPGESASIATAIEGNMMAKAGRAGPALATSAIGSFVAGSLAVVLLTLMAPLVVEFALKFGPAEYFAVMVLAFTTVSALLGSSRTRGLASLCFGLFLGMIGIDRQTGQARFTFGIPQLFDGIDVVVVAVGLFAIGETFYLATYLNRIPDRIEKMKGSIWMSRSDWKRSWKPWLRGTALGFPFGAMPAGGAEIPTFLSYAIEKKLSQHPEEFGKGAIEGVAGPEAANNASVTGSMTMLLALGLPVSVTTALVLVAFTQYGLQPGPLLFQSNAALVWGLIASMYIGNVLLLVLNLPLVGIWIQLLRIPRPLLYAGILVFATLGTYGIRNDWFDLLLLYLIGLIGFLMRRYDIPVAPTIVGMILGPLAEQNLRRALSISQGDLSIFVTKPISATIFAIVLLVLVAPPVWKLVAAGRARRRPRRA
jgi:putative tricarboxylic transport membrane protein